MFAVFGGGHSVVKERPCDGSRRHDILCVLGREVKGGPENEGSGFSGSEWGVGVEAWRAAYRSRRHRSLTVADRG